MIKNILTLCVGLCITPLMAAETTAPLHTADSPTTAARKDRNVILVTSDGLRWQEVFRGANEAMFTETNKVTTPSLLREKYAAATPEERRERLMTFLWKEAATRGQIYGNRDKGSIAHVSNDKWFSYPGYNELLTGHPDNSIASNKKIPNKNHTVFEWLNTSPELKGKVAAFAQWAAFPAIFNNKRSGVYVYAGKGDPYEAFKKYVQTEKPRVMFLGFGSTDGQAHAGDYRQYLDAAHRVDTCLADLWKTLQSMPQYKDNTTIIFTADHGRGNSKKSPKAWNSHGRSTPESDSLFLAVWGPDTKTIGEVSGGPEIIQAQVAATVAAALGYDYPAAQPKAAPPISAALSGNAGSASR